MQYLIDSIVSILLQKVGIKERLPAASTHDWGTVQLSNVAWQTWDCSSIVPPGTKAIVLRCVFEASASGRQLFITTEDETAWASMAFCRVISANQLNMQDKIIALTDGLTFKTRVNVATWTRLDLTISHYFLAGVWQDAFHNRGDPALSDFGLPGLIADGNWHTLDLSNIIPLQTTAVLLAVELASPTASNAIYFRTLGNVNSQNQSKCLVIDPGYTAGYDVTVPTNGRNQIEYRVRNGFLGSIFITVKGWWF